MGTPKIGPTGGRDPKTYSSISITPYLNPALPYSPSPPEPPWAPKNFLGPQEALGAFGSLQQPWVFSETHRPCFPYSPSPPLTPSALPLVPSYPLSLPGLPWIPWDLPGTSESLGSLHKPLAALGLQSYSEALLPLLPLTPSLPLAPSHPLRLPRPFWVSRTFLGPQEALGAFTSIWQPLAALGLQSYSGAVLSLLPLTPSLAPSGSLLPPLTP